MGERLEAALRLALERHGARAAETHGRWLACGPGCSACCVGPFPITRLDARWLLRGLAELRSVDRARAERIDERAEAAVARLAPGFPGDPETGRVEADTPALDRFFGSHSGLACPALHPASGRCELYVWRPVACRTYGPPLRYGNTKTEPCRLCFQGATPEQIDDARSDPDPRRLEERILEGLGSDPRNSWETLIAFALATGNG